MNLLKDIKKESFYSIVGWTSGVFLGLLGVGSLFDNQIGLGILLLVLSSVILPPSENKLFEILKIKKFKYAKMAAFILGFILFGNFVEKDNSQKAELAQKSVVKNTQSVNQQEVSAEPEKSANKEVEQKENQVKLYNVTKVVDGDTVEVEVEGKREVLRLIGINTPETVDPRKSVECFGKEASAKSKEILEGKKVSLEADPTQGELDKYNRLLRYIFLEDGRNFNKMMIEEGYAYEYTYNIPYKYQTDFKNAQQQARDNKRGLWAENTCNGNLTVSSEPATQTTTITTTVPTTEAKTVTQNGGSFSGSCAGKKTCGQMTSCQEAKFYLNSCGVGSLDRDKDGIPCETICN